MNTVSRPSPTFWSASHAAIFPVISTSPCRSARTVRKFRICSMAIRLWPKSTDPSQRAAAFSDPIAVVAQLFLIKIIQPDTSPSEQASARLLDTTQEALIVLEPVIEPVLLGFESDQPAGLPC